MLIDHKTVALETDIEADVPAALRIVRRSIGRYDIQHCAGCFNALTEVMYCIDLAKDLEADYLAVWAEFVRESQTRQGCNRCQPPNWRIQGISQIPTLTTLS